MTVFWEEVLLLRSPQFSGRLSRDKGKAIWIWGQIYAWSLRCTKGLTRVRHCVRASIHIISYPLDKPYKAAIPNHFDTREWLHRKLFHGQELGAGGRFGMILIRSTQSRSRTCTVHSRVHAPMTI